jgi:hypothetical protein
MTIHASAEEKAVQAMDPINEMPEQEWTGRWKLQTARRHVNIAVQRLHHSEDEPAHNAS